MNLEVVPADTTPEAAAVQIEIFRQMDPSKRLELAFQMTNAMRELVASGVRDRHPEHTPDQVRLAVARLTLGEELFRKVYPGVEIAVWPRQNS